jgi:predicted RNase H-like nuclease (RuvC/YqgF family)
MRHDCTREIAEAVADKDAEIERLNERVLAIECEVSGAIGDAAEAEDVADARDATIADLRAQLAEERDHRSLAEQALLDMRRAGDFREWAMGLSADFHAWTSTDSGPTDMPEREGGV